MPNPDDDDWLYRRGPHDAPPPDADSTRVLPTQPAPSSFPPPASRPSVPLPPPTPVAHHGPRPAAPAPAPGSPLPRAARPRRRPRWGLRLGLAVGVLVAYLLGVPAVTWTRLAHVPASPATQRPNDTPGQLILLAGSDARDGLTPQEQQRLGTGSDAGRRTDTIMLLFVPVSGKAALISVPRDSYVTIPGHGKNKINAAYSIGGPELLVATLERATGLRVDAYAEVGFGGFVNVVDAVGGIEMCPAQAINDRDSNLNIKAGCQNFDGVTALGYVRMRKADPLGDLGRVQRQREMLGALAKKTASPLTVLLPWRYWGVNAAGASAVTLGEGDGLGELAAIGVGVAKLGTGDGVTLTVPVANADAHTAAGSSVLWNEPEAKALFADIARGDTSQLTRFVK